MSVAQPAIGRRRRSTGPNVKRQKQALIGLCIFLTAAVAFEAPALLKSVGGSSAGGAAAPTSAATTTTATPVPTVTQIPGGGSTTTPKDVFRPQIGSAGGAAPAPPLSAGPAVRATGFVAKNPFIPQSAATTTTPTTSTPTPTASTPTTTAPTTSTPTTSTPTTPTVGTLTGYVVVIASIPVAKGQAAAGTAAQTARAAGLAAHVLLSSDYPLLRAGYYAVYTGTYATRSAAIAAIAIAAKHGYAAYPRNLG